jgi:hypothetical protein
MNRARLTRDEVIDAVSGALQREPFVLAVWLGGSDGTGRTDRYSDIDLGVIAEDDFVEEAFARFDAILEELSPVEFRYRLPEPTWHGNSQVFARLRDADPHHFLDLCVLGRSSTDRFVERERHGEAKILYDPENLLTPVDLDWGPHAKKLRARFDAIRQTFVMFQPLPIRAVARGFPAEAAYFYQNLTLKPFVELLRMRYCPERFDFGFRYLDRDLPHEVRSEVESLAFPHDSAEADRFRARVEMRVGEELAAFDRGEWTLPPV